MPTDVSLKEAAAIAEVPEAAVRKAVESGVVRPRAVQHRRVHRLRFRARDLVYVKVVADFPWDLPRVDKVALREIIENRCASAGRWQARDGEIVAESSVGELRLDIRRLRHALVDRMKAFVRGRRRVVSDPQTMGGEPVFAGTRIPVAHVAGLFAKQVPLSEIAEDYPALTANDLRFASMVALMKPDPGRPRKPLTLIRDGRPVATVDRVVTDRAAPH